MVTYVATPNLIIFLADPVTELKNPVPSHLTATIISAIHIYHIVAFKCSKEDIMHHVLFVLVGTLIQVMP